MSESEVASPCIKICVLDERQVCKGCGRHIDEIATWSSAGRERKLEILGRARERLAADEAGRSGNPENR